MPGAGAEHCVRSLETDGGRDEDGTRYRKCTCKGEDPDCKRCAGTGYYAEDD